MENLQKMRVLQYLEAYEKQEVVGMMAGMHPDVVFENVSGGEVNLRTEGREALRKQAESALAYFSARKQTPTSWQIEPDRIEIGIHYEAVLAVDFPMMHLKTGEKLVLEGRSVFRFLDNQIIALTDFS